jgi:hypothetical protein
LNPEAFLFAHRRQLCSSGGESNESQHTIWIEPEGWYLIYSSKLMTLLYKDTPPEVIFNAISRILVTSTVSILRSHQFCLRTDFLNESSNKI